jgi:hypothetical protein
MAVNDAKCPCPFFQHRYVFRFESFLTHSFPSQLVNNWLDGVLPSLDSIVNYRGVQRLSKTGVFLTKLVRKGKKGQYSNYINIWFAGRILKTGDQEHPKSSVVAERKSMNCYDSSKQNGSMSSSPIAPAL